MHTYAIHGIVQTPILTPNNDMILSTPTTVHIELTSVCNLRCRHCYNFWRQDNSVYATLNREQLDCILAEIIENKVMHVILTGGEPMINYEQLIYAIEKLTEENISVSCNSNISLATPQRLEALHKAGLEHILTSLNSYDTEIDDFITSTIGAHNKVIKAIKAATDIGIRISVNMIVSQTNINHVYKTAELAARLGAQKFFATRLVPNVSLSLDAQKEFLIEEKEVITILNELLRIQEDLGLQTGTLVPYPFCFLKGIEKYKMLYTHGCPAGNKMMLINANGETHACVHESESYGNIFEIGLKSAWENMRQRWQIGEIFPNECKRCSLFDECNAGCRIIAKAFNGALDKSDNLRRGWGGNMERKQLENNLREGIENGYFRVPDTLRFRKEDGFYVIDRAGSEILCVKDHIAKIIIKHKNKELFTLEDVEYENRKYIEALLHHKLLLFVGKGNQDNE